MDAYGNHNGEEKEASKPSVATGAHDPTTGSVSSEVARIEEEDRPKHRRKRSSGIGRGTASKRDRAAYLEVTYADRDGGAPYCRGFGSGHVYLVFDTVTKLYKVGKSVQLYTRLRLLANGTRNELWLLGYIATNDPIRLESEWKLLWASKNVSDEWFSLSDADIRHFKSVLAVRYFVALPGVRVPRRDPLAVTIQKCGKSRTPIKLGGPIIKRKPLD